MPKPNVSNLLLIRIEFEVLDSRLPEVIYLERISACYTVVEYFEFRIRGRCLVSSRHQNLIGYDVAWYVIENSVWKIEVTSHSHCVRIPNAPERRDLVYPARHRLSYASINHGWPVYGNP